VPAIAHAVSDYLPVPDDPGSHGQLRADVKIVQINSANVTVGISPNRTGC
jgi:hypothetical protein